MAGYPRNHSGKQQIFIFLKFISSVMMQTNRKSCLRPTQPRADNDHIDQCWRKWCLMGVFSSNDGQQCQQWRKIVERDIWLQTLTITPTHFVRNKYLGGSRFRNINSFELTGFPKLSLERSLTSNIKLVSHIYRSFLRLTDELAVEKTSMG